MESSKSDNNSSKKTSDSPSACLAQTGVSQQTVEGSPKQPLAESTPPWKSKKWLMSILAGVLLLSLGTTGFFAYQNHQLKQKLVMQNLSMQSSCSSPSPSSTSLPSEINLDSTELEGTDNLPPPTGGNILVDVENIDDTRGKEGTVEVSVEYDEIPDRNYTYSVNLLSLNYGLLGLSPPPSRIPATVSIWAVSPSGKKSDTLKLRNDEYWDAVAKTQCDYVGKHRFVFNREDRATDLIYETKSEY